MTDESDRYATWDAAYVLGALTPDERREFQTHLVDCDSCRESVADLAVVPDLLALVPPDNAIAMLGERPPADDRPMPPTMLRELVTQTERKRRRGKLIAVGAAVATAAAAVAIAVPLASGLGDDAGPQPSTSEQVIAQRSMVNLIPTPLSADFSVVALPDGNTRIEMACRYSDSSGYNYKGRYAMYVSTDRSESKVAEWEAQKGDVITASPVVADPAATIRRVDIRNVATNEVILLGTLD